MVSPTFLRVAEGGTAFVTLFSSGGGYLDGATVSVSIQKDTDPVLPDVEDKNGTVGTAWNIQLPAATGGNAPLTYSLTGLPSAPQFDARPRTTTGSIISSGTYPLVFMVTDNDGDHDVASFGAIVHSTQPVGSVTFSGDAFVGSTNRRLLGSIMGPTSHRTGYT